MPLSGLTHWSHKKSPAEEDQQRYTSRTTPDVTLSVRHEWLAQFSETLAIASSALGTARSLIAKRRTPFSPRAHYELSIWFWAHSYARWPRPHELGELHDSTPTLTDVNSQLLTFG